MSNMYPLHRYQRKLLLLVLTTLLFTAAYQTGQLRARSGRDNSTSLNAPFVLRVYYDQIRDLEALQDYDVWEYNNLAERYVLISADPLDYDRLKADGWRMMIDQAATLRLQSRRKAGFEDGYRTVDELHADLETLNQDNPRLVELVDYGDSYCKSIGGCSTLGGDSQLGADLLAIRITNEDIPGSSDVSSANIIRGEKPIFFLMANIHAREITTPEIAMRFVDSLLEDYDQNADVTWLVDWHELWVVPTVNPDGHWLVTLGTTEPYNGLPFSQRKNANMDADANTIVDCNQWPPYSFAQYGVDLNRNHSFGWGPPGSSNAPCNMTYRGPAAASEVEVAQLESLLRDLIPDQRGPNLEDKAPSDTTGLLISMHSYSNLVLWPWGFIYDPAPNRSDLKAIGDRLAIFNGYESCQPTECLYAANGTSDDWAYGELGIPAFTFEIGDEFMPPYETIDEIQWPENRGALYYAARIARTPYETIQGPEVNGLSSTEDSLGIMLSATIDDSLNGDHPIAAATYSIDYPPWHESAVIIPMLPEDDDFDSSVENVHATIDTTGLTPGRYTVFVRGRDAQGNDGVVSALFIEVSDPEVSETNFLPVISVP